MRDDDQKHYKLKHIITRQTTYLDKLKRNFRLPTNMEIIQE